ncbi:hypothetical protein, partial [Micromonospora fulviviridis]
MIRVVHEWVTGQSLVVPTEAEQLWQHFVAQVQWLAGVHRPRVQSMVESAPEAAAAWDWASVVGLWRTYEQITALAPEGEWPSAREVFHVDLSPFLRGTVEHPETWLTQVTDDRPADNRDASSPAGRDPLERQGLGWSGWVRLEQD